MCPLQLYCVTTETFVVQKSRSSSPSMVYTTLENALDQLTTSENTITYHNALCLSPQYLDKYCLQFLLGVNMAREKLKTMLLQNFEVTNKEINKDI